jgi:MFS family permease
MERKWWTLLAVSVATFMLLLDITIVNVALPSIRQDLGASFTDLQWVVDAYVLTLAALVLRAAARAGAVWRGGGAGGAGRGRHPAVPAGRRLGVRRRPGPWALPGGLAWGFGFPDRLLRAAASVDGLAVTLARAALAPRPRPRYRPGLRNRLSTRLLTALPTRLSDRVKRRSAGEAEVAPPAAPRPRPTQPRASANDEDADAEGTRG